MGLVLQTMMPFFYLLATDIVLVAAAFAALGLASAAGELGWLGCVILFAERDRAPDYSALHSLLLGLRGLLGPVVGNLLYSLGGLDLRQVLFVSFAIQVVGVLIMLWMMRSYRSPALGVRKGD